MGLKVKNESSVGLGLLKYGDRTTRALRHVQEKGAKEIAQVADEMAPYKTGELVDSIEIFTEKEGRRTSKIVRVQAPHAAKMHESHYNLGPGSLEKQESSRFVVGRKYLERAAKYVLYEGGLLDRARQAMRKK